MEFDSIGTLSKSDHFEDGGIQVVTTLAQAVDRDSRRDDGSRGETESTKGLVRETYYHGA